MAVGPPALTIPTKSGVLTGIVQTRAKRRFDRIKLSPILLQAFTSLVII
jgi:hypothetical protein